MLRTNPLKNHTGEYSGSQMVRCEPPHPPPVPLVRSTFVRGPRFPSLSFPSFSALSLSPESPPFFAVFSRGFLISFPVHHYILWCGPADPPVKTTICCVLCLSPSSAHLWLSSWFLLVRPFPVPFPLTPRFLSPPVAHQPAWVPSRSLPLIPT
ncbi:hypothetical protein ES703_101186 [subsurface metagenome]